MKKYLLWITVLAALTGLLCLSAAAVDVDMDAAVASVGAAEFTALSDAFAAFNADSEAESVKLLADVPSLDWVLTKDTVLDLNGFTVTSNNTTGGSSCW